MKKLFLAFLLPVLLASCSQPDKRHFFNNTSEWTAGGTAQIEDTILTLTDKSAIAQYVKEYRNFELNVECKTSAGAIGGIWFHSARNVDDTAPRSGYEVLINNNIERTDWRKTGSLSAIRNVAKRTANNDEWFPINIKVIGKQIKVYINNVWLVDYTEPAEPFRTEAYTKRFISQGFLTFINQTDQPILFRNLKVVALADYLEEDGVNDIDEQTDNLIRLQQANFPLIDSHAHLKGWGKDEAATMSRKVGITYAMAPNCGLKFPVTSDADIDAFLDTMQSTPFLLPMQAEGREWLTLFSKEGIDKFDYRFTDALTWTDNKGRRQRIWIEEETYIDDKQKFMDMLVDRACTIILNEPIDVFVNPTFIPEALQPEYEELWTEKRMKRIIDACMKKNVALEINNRFKVPSERLIKQAKEAGVKFTFGTNNLDPDMGRMEYAVEMIEKCDLTPEDLFIPLSNNL